MFDVFKQTFMKTALIGSCIVGVTCSYFGLFLILKRMIFVGITLAQFSGFGIALAVFLGKNPFPFALAFTFLGILIMFHKRLEQRIPPDTIIGIGFASAWALSILLLSKAEHGDAELLNLMQGNILGILPLDINLILIFAIPVAILQILFYREFLYINFDSEMAKTQGLNEKLWNFLFYLSVGIIVALSIKLSGVLLTFSYLLLPGAVSLIISERINICIIISIATALIGTLLGLYLSFVWDMPSGPLICGVLFLFFIVIFLINRLVLKRI